MTASAYHLFNDIYQRRHNLKSTRLAAENFMLRDDLIACRGGSALFPDIVLQTNQNNSMFQGGEFIEIKDARNGYTIASFNSTIPSAYKNTIEYITPRGKLYKQMRENQDIDPYLLNIREVYYLIRGYKSNNCKVCLVQGSFFETISATNNIKSALKDALYEAMQDTNLKDDSDAIRAAERVLGFNWKREHLAKVRKNKDASVSIRMRVMSEVINEANVLNPNLYPAIKDNTLNMIVPGSPDQNYQKLEQEAIRKMASTFGNKKDCLPDDLIVNKLKHLKNGSFILFQTNI